MILESAFEQLAHISAKSWRVLLSDPLGLRLLVTMCEYANRFTGSCPMLGLPVLLNLCPAIRPQPDVCR